MDVEWDTPLILFFELTSMLGGNEELPGGFKTIRNKNVDVEYFEWIIIHVLLETSLGRCTDPMTGISHTKNSFFALMLAF